MGRAWFPELNADLLRRSLRLFLPISGALSLVLLPMLLLYEHGRRDVVQARVEGLVEASSGEVLNTLREVRASTGVITTLPVVPDLLTTDRPSPLQRQRVETMMRSQLREVERLRALVVFDTRGQPLAQQVRGASLPPPAALRTALSRAAGLTAGQLWISPVQWPVRGAPELLVSRPLFSTAAERRGVLLAVVTLEPLARDFNQITNRAPALQRGYLLSGDGRTINAPPGAAAGLDFAARFPQVWRQIQLQPRGVVNTDQGLFLYLVDPLRPGARAGRNDGMFLFDSGQRQQHLAVVIQVPRASLYRTSAFSQPAGLALVGLLYGLAAATSVGIVGYRRHLEELHGQDRRLQQRLETVQRSAGVGMCLCDPLSGRFLSVNAALCDFFGRREQDLLHCTWQQLTHPEDLEADRKLAAQLQRGEIDTYRLRKRFLRPDGRTIWGDLVVSCSRDADGAISDLIGQISDVTELLAKSDYLEAASSAGVVGVWDWDVPRDVLTWDAVMYRLYGLHAEDFRGTREAWERAVHPDDKAFVTQELQAALRGWREYQPRFRVIWPDGSIHYVQARSHTTYGPDGTALRMIGVNYDISEQVERELEVEEQRQLLATTLDALMDPLLFLALRERRGGPAQLHIADLNAAAATFFHRTQPQLLGQRLLQVIPEALNRGLHQQLLAVACGGAPYIADEAPVQLGERQPPLALDLRAVRVRDGLVLSFRDVTERRAALRNLAASEERFRLLAENVTDVVFLCEEAGRISWMAPGLRSALGWSSDRWLGHSLGEFCHPDDRTLTDGSIRRVEAGEAVIVRLRLRDDQERWHWVEVHAGPNRSADGQQRGMVAALRVVDEEVEAEAELDRRARTDPLTGLLNRQEIFDQMQRMARRRRASDGALAVLFCDIDHFKAINDRHGHAGGDRVLQVLGERLRQTTRRGDLVGRIGGDELLVVLQAIPSLEAAMAIATKIHHAAHQPLQLPEGELVPTLSIGVTLIHPQEPVDAVVARADQAMYEAKTRGRDRVMAMAVD